MTPAQERVIERLGSVLSIAADSGHVAAAIPIDQLIVIDSAGRTVSVRKPAPHVFADEASA